MPIWLDTPTRPSPFHVGTWRSCTRSCTSCGLPSIAIGLTSGSPCHPHNRATTCTTFFFLPVSTTPHLSFSPSRPAPPPPSPDDPSLRCRCAAAANSGKYVRSPLFFPSPTASPYGGGSEPIGLDWNLVFGLDLDLVSMVWTFGFNPKVENGLDWVGWRACIVRFGLDSKWKYLDWFGFDVCRGLDWF